MTEENINFENSDKLAQTAKNKPKNENLCRIFTLSLAMFLLFSAMFSVDNTIPNL
jgi:hypothetical protein